MSCSCENRGRLRNIKLSESKGSLLIVKASCRNCAKDFLWRSQPQLGRKSKGNVELATSIYVTYVITISMNYDNDINLVLSGICEFCDDNASISSEKNMRINANSLVPSQFSNRTQ